ncbi:MAG: hypothetical protein KR126chlam4_00704 [Candidatus Anoxychlamydiales bacterium]|nr:hypothetical protein [Candidatus Anoxychlamydiales bacterium]
MTSKILNSPISLSTTNGNFPKKIPSINDSFKKSFQKVKNFAKLLFENTIFQISLLGISSLSFFAACISIGSTSFLIATLVSTIALAILIKKKFSNFIYELSTTDSFIRQKKFNKRWPWFNQITKNIFLGAVPLKNLNHEKIFIEKNITSILSIIEEKETTKKTIFTTPINLSYWKKNNFSHLHISIKDRYPISKDKLQKAADFIQREVLNNKKIYVHCTAGRSRSAMAIIAYLLKYKKMDLKEAFRFMKSKRRVLFINYSQRIALKVFRDSLLTSSCK